MKTAVQVPEPLVRRFMPELDVLRGIAVLGVLFYHGFRAQYGELPFTGARRFFVQATQPGVLGVNLFFVLSGFLITGFLLDSRNRPDYYRRFYTRRALRILPAYYLLLILLGLLHQASAAFLGLSFVYLSNVTGLFGVAMDYHPLWSLAVEEHYYIVWPSVVRKLGPEVSGPVFSGHLHPHTNCPSHRFPLRSLSSGRMVHVVCSGRARCG